ncbi:hypothetical protein HELRODRAFT_156203 [Helobdella robusta]|uniref:Cilia- and flagella-associated protein 299 n=1 Tax=Helobdella robusta TaxID=6412 RepID=T1ELS6_HELRO|nr:hypothetical protein HELRODRAFT_156203 [Helobdella robusta]ESN90720.1 hypothetical protein HELRODRAFT_156203 [Helobdella robusta]
MEKSNGAKGVDNITEFNTYEEFLDSQITSLDLYYLEDEDIARELVELGYRGNGEVLKLDDFVARKQAFEANRLAKKNQQQNLSAQCKIPEELKLMSELAKREDGNRQGIMATIIFIRDYNTKKQEVSGYIDYAYRLKVEDFTQYFNGKKKLMPKLSDLSFFNWETQMSTSNSSSNYQIITNNPTGLLFKNRRDRKIMNVDPRAFSPGENSVRIDVLDTNYIHVVLFDHITRRKF